MVRAKEVAQERGIRGIRGLSGAALRLWARSAPKLDADVVMPELADAGFGSVQQATTLGGGIAMVTACRGWAHMNGK